MCLLLPDIWYMITGPAAAACRFSPEGSKQVRRWCDGSIMADLPIQGLREQFNVNFTGQWEGWVGHCGVCRCCVQQVPARRPPPGLSLSSQCPQSPSPWPLAPRSGFPVQPLPAAAGGVQALAAPHAGRAVGDRVQA